MATASTSPLGSLIQHTSEVELLPWVGEVTEMVGLLIASRGDQQSHHLGNFAHPRQQFYFGSVLDQGSQRGGRSGSHIRYPTCRSGRVQSRAIGYRRKRPAGLAKCRKTIRRDSESDRRTKPGSWESRTAPGTFAPTIPGWDACARG